MDYSELVEALQNGDDVVVNQIIKEMTPRLIRFLEIRMRAPTTDAEDCVQTALERALGLLKAGELNDENRVLSYLMSTCRNIYLKEKNKITELNYDRVPSSEFNTPNQLQEILDEERKRILKICLEQLEGMYRKVIDYWFTYPDSDADTAAEHLNISKNNVWTRKHRAIKKLNECYKEKSNK